MFHKRKGRKDYRGSFWRRSLSFFLVLLLVAGCVQVVGNQAEAAANVREQETEIGAESQSEQGNSLETEATSEPFSETQAGTEILLSETEPVTETESEITTEAYSEPVSESESVAIAGNPPETETETIRATEADSQPETEWETETTSDLNPETESEPGPETETEVETQAETEPESETVSEQETESEAETETETESESETETESKTETEKQHANFVAFQEKLALFEASGIQDDNWLEAQALLEEIQKSYEEEGLTEEDYKNLSERLKALLEVYYNRMAERAEGNAWLSLMNSGWFQQYSGYTGADAEVETEGIAVSSQNMEAQLNQRRTARVPQPSDVQVVNQGGSETSKDGVTISKTIQGTDLENVFDITLQVSTPRDILEVYKDPDMAVVIVMDISNTMTSNFNGVTRYQAAMTAAEEFLNKFAESSKGASKVGYVAFNTDAHEIFGLQSCSSQSQANTLKDKMRTGTGKIINASGYKDDHSRFTNIEAGLSMGKDMLKGATNKNKYIIFLSDGFPTTYISSVYKGYDPYDSAGTRFKDRVLNKPCTYGTSYSNEAAIRARNKAAEVKASGITIFSIGVDVGGQTIQQYITQSEKADGFSVVDRTGTAYEIGDASSPEAYKTWLRNSIGSGYYYDSTDLTGLQEAYDDIFAKIRDFNEITAEAQWVANDPLPSSGTASQMVEFIGFYNQKPELVKTNLSGTHESNGENTAVYDSDKTTIRWDLKKSGYVETGSGTSQIYSYQLVYRVRLKNEAAGFTENKDYDTNDTTSLNYQIFEGDGDNVTASEPKTMEFPIPSVKGYLVELEFSKRDTYNRAVVGAEFTLSHDTEKCRRCHGDGTITVIPDKKAVSDENGKVSFTAIPSGHQYRMTESKVPDGYYSNGNQYLLTAAYNELTIKTIDRNGKLLTDTDDTLLPRGGIVTNSTQYELPSTGGMGTLWYTTGGWLTLFVAALFLLYKKIKGKDDGRNEEIH